jgi:hypothetical protein
LLRKIPKRIFYLSGTWPVVKIKLALNNTITDKTITCASENWNCNKKRQIFYRRILVPVYDEEKEKFGNITLTDK